MHTGCDLQWTENPIFVLSSIWLTLLLDYVFLFLITTLEIMQWAPSRLSITVFQMTLCMRYELRSPLWLMVFNHPTPALHPSHFSAGSVLLFYIRINTAAAALWVRTSTNVREQIVPASWWARTVKTRTRVPTVWLQAPKPSIGKKKEKKKIKDSFRSKQQCRS